MTTQRAPKTAGAGVTVTKKSSTWDYWNRTCNVAQLVLVLIPAADNSVQGLAMTWERLAAGYRSTLLHHPTL